MVLYKITKERRNSPLYLVIEGSIVGEYSSPGSVIYVWEDLIAPVSLKQIENNKFQARKYTLSDDTE